MSLYDYGRDTTPQIKRISKDGVVFQNAIATAPWTLPSHASMFTGRPPNQLSADWGVPLDGTYPTLAEILSHHGYTTAGFAANRSYCSRDFGLSRGFAHYEDYRITAGQALLYTSFGVAARDTLQMIERFGTYRNFGRKSAEQVSADFLSWLSGNDRRPFFTFLNYNDAHDPYLPPAPFGKKFADHTPRGFIGDVADGATDDIVRELRDGYDGSIAYLDQQMGALVDALEARNVANDTLIVITSDHGEQFGEHNLFVHGNSLYRPLLHVPLLFLWPGHVPAGVVVPDLVSLTDLPATLLDLAGVSPDAVMPGHSLGGLWRGDAATQQPAAYSEFDNICNMGGKPCLQGRHQSLVSSGYHYIICPDGQEELYDFNADPQEVADLAETPGGRDAIAQMRALLPRG
jgi:arylsulfatase A-like enzyme